MSRIGKLPVTVPAGVDVTLGDSVVVVKGPKGQLSQHVLPVVTITLEDGVIVVARKSDDKPGRSAHGLTRTLIANMIDGVTKGFRKSLELQGVGYRVNKAGSDLNFSLGYSHPVTFSPPEGIAFSVEGTNKIHVEGIDKQRVGQVAAEIRSLRPPEPYKGKGIRYEGETVRKKLGKAGKAGKK
jgi:large subunit ribosomal protein L6